MVRLRPLEVENDGKADHLQKFQKLSEYCLRQLRVTYLSYLAPSAHTKRHRLARRSRLDYQTL